MISLHEGPTDYCKALRQVIEASPSPERLRALWGRNTVTIEMLRANLRDLGTEAGEHYADIVLSLYQRQIEELHQEQEADQAVAETSRRRPRLARRARRLLRPRQRLSRKQPHPTHRARRLVMRTGVIPRSADNDP